MQFAVCFQYMYCTAEQPAVMEEEGVYSGMLIRKHQWESTTKKASNRLVIIYTQCFKSEAL